MVRTKERNNGLCLVLDMSGRAAPAAAVQGSTEVQQSTDNHFESSAHYNKVHTSTVRWDKVAEYRSRVLQTVQCVATAVPHTALP